ncbi:LOW QUALITY PROTEIN: E3 ubiquitin-protein ligase RBBP6-like [Theristicus caerulescens]
MEERCPRKNSHFCFPLCLVKFCFWLLLLLFLLFRYWFESNRICFHRLVSHRDGKGNKHKQHQKRSKGDENEGFPKAELLEGARKPKEPVTAADVKTDSLFMLPGRDDATPVRDEPMEADSIAFKPVSEKEKQEKEKPKAKLDKTKRKAEVAVLPKRDKIIKPAKASQEKLDTDREESPPMEPAVKKVKGELPKTDNVKMSSSQKDEKALGSPGEVHPKVTKDHPETRPANEETAKTGHQKETKSEKPSTKEGESKKAAEKSKPSDAKPEKRKRKADEKVAKEHEATSIKASKPETAESNRSPKGKTEPDGEKGEQTPEKEKSAFLNTRPKKMKLNQETGKKAVSGENVLPAKEPVEKPEPNSGKVQQEKAKGKVRRKVTAADGSSSTLVDCTSTSSTGGSPVRKTEEKPDTKRTVIKSMEEYHNDITAPEEDIVIIIQVPQSKWEKDDSESEEEDIKSTQVPASVGEPANAIKNVSAKPPNPVKHSEKETEPLKETQKATKEVSYESSQRDAKSSKSSMSSERGKTKDGDHSLSDKDTSEKRQSSVQQEKDHSERATEQGNGKSISQSSEDRRFSEKHDTGHGSAAKDFTANQDKKSDRDGNRDYSSSKRRDEKSESARRKDSPSQKRESTSAQKSKPREEGAELSEKRTGGERSSSSPARERQQSDRKAARDSKRPLEDPTQTRDENAGKEKEKQVPEVKSNEEKEPGGDKPPLRQESPGVKNEKENATGQSNKSAVEPKPQVSSSSQLSSDLTRETDEAVFVPDRNDADSERDVAAKGEEAAGKNHKEPKAKAVDKVTEDAAAPAAADQPEASRSQSQSSACVRRSCSQSPSESQPGRHRSSASSGESQDSREKEKKKEKKKDKKQKKHKKQKEHIGNERELEKGHKHKQKKWKKSTNKEKDEQKVESVPT